MWLASHPPFWASTVPAQGFPSPFASRLCLTCLAGTTTTVVCRGPIPRVSCQIEPLRAPFHSVPIFIEFDSVH